MKEGNAREHSPGWRCNVVGKALRFIDFADGLHVCGRSQGAAFAERALMSQSHSQPLSHIPVMLTEVLTALAPQADETFIDATFGAGGYTSALLEAGAHVIAFDRDPDAIAAGRQRFENARNRVTFFEAPFSAMAEALAGPGIAAIHGVVFDLGVSSMQLDQAKRGFSFRFDGPLDMRMSQSGKTAADLVNRLDEGDLANIIFRYGEERRSRAVARMIVARRQTTPFTRTLELAEAVAKVVGKPGPERIHPATRTFQALRIAVNGELDELAEGLSAAEALLVPGGRLACVSFHSLEDRLIKRFLAERSQASNPSRHAPALATAPQSFQLNRRGAANAGPTELHHNPRARSAKLRSAVRTAAEPWPLERRGLGPAAFGMLAGKGFE